MAGTSRRETLKTLSIGIAAGSAPLLWLTGNRSQAATGRSLNMNLLGFSLGIHIPAVTAVVDLLPEMPGYAPPTVVRIQMNRIVTQALVSETTEIGQTDAITVLRAVEQGADLKIIGNSYLYTSIVFVANADKVQDIKDLAKPGVTVAVNGIGDGSHVMLVGPLLKRGVDISKMTVIEIGGSGERLRALLAKRVDAVPVHFDQAASIEKSGNYKVLLRPWQEYPVWVNEIWAVNASWLKKPENRRAAVDLMKASIMAFRKANSDFAWYADKYRKHVTLPNAAQTTDDTIRPIWQGLVQDVKAWPSDGNFKVDHFRQLLPVYKAGDGIAGTVNVERVVDTSFVEQALKELP